MMKEEAVNVGLLKTKFSIPGVNKQLLPRRFLNLRLEDSLNHKLTVITAPAGYGKTTAVLKWLQNSSLPSAWLSIDAGDNDALVFWRYLCAALDSIMSGISQNTEYVFASPELFQANVHLRILINRLSNVSSDFLIILDDFHLITNKVIFDGLSYFIGYLPEKMHLVLISRVEPHLKLARLGLKEDLVRIRANELCFNTEEISQYYEARGYFLQEEEIQRIEVYSEGWATALVAVALSFRDEKNRRNVISSFAGCGRHIESYLAEDVYNTWTNEQQDLMERMSILSRLCGPLCEAITGYDGNIMLKELYDQNCFLVALDNEGIWFRYHHLFAEFLKKKLINKDAASLQGLHLRAGEWLHANSFYDEAIDHFLAAMDYEKALPLIEKQGAGLLRKREYSNVIAWLEKLPDLYTQNNPRIMVLKGAYLTGIGDFEKAWECMESLQLVLQDTPALSQTFHTEYMMIKADLLILQGDFEKALPAIIEAAACDVNNTMSKDYVDFNLYDISMYRTMYHSAIKMLRKSPAKYETLIRNFRSLVSTHPGFSQLIKGEFYYESGKLNEALPELIASVNEAAHANCPGALVPAMITLARIRRAQGDIPGAMEVIEECEIRAEKFHKPHWSYMLKAFKVRLYIDIDDTEMIDKWIRESRLGMYQDIVTAREYELIVLARVFIHRQRFNDAHILLNRLLGFAEGLKRNHSTVEISNLLAITAVKNLDEEIAEKNLEKSLSIGIKEGYVRSFVDELAPMASLLEMYIRKRKNRGRLAAYARKLLSQTKNSVKHSIFPAGANIIEDLLTPVEKKVLHLIIDTYTNQEIADELGITLRTVKAHTGNIYKKLGVKSRIQCIKKVRGT
ncbi:MAG TPA: LuxR C-terminal-related transcriptional regulator [Syntrophomonadaceae bacterium]|nr:LuxR C-terminal-related transcriptional regulator [Syntrophomonadaceae bacterium]